MDIEFREGVEVFKYVPKGLEDPVIRLKFGRAAIAEMNRAFGPIWSFCPRIESSPSGTRLIFTHKTTNSYVGRMRVYKDPHERTMILHRRHFFVMGTDPAVAAGKFGPGQGVIGRAQDGIHILLPPHINRSLPKIRYRQVELFDDPTDDKAGSKGSLPPARESGGIQIKFAGGTEVSVGTVDEAADLLRKFNRGNQYGTS